MEIIKEVASDLETINGKLVSKPYSTKHQRRTSVISFDYNETEGEDSFKDGVLTAFNLLLADPEFLQEYFREQKGDFYYTHLTEITELIAMVRSKFNYTRLSIKNNAEKLINPEALLETKPDELDGEVSKVLATECIAVRFVTELDYESPTECLVKLLLSNMVSAEQVLSDVWFREGTVILSDVSEKKKVQLLVVKQKSGMRSQRDSCLDERRF